MPTLARHFTCALRRCLSSSLAITAASSNWACTERPLAEQEPITHNLFVDAVNLDRVEKIDLLFMIDNSASMGDKQTLLAQAVPKLLQRLVNPPCIDEATAETFTVDSPDSACPRGEREFPPVKDVHVAVITSSLGTLGSVQCQASDPVAGIYNNDLAHLVATMRSPSPETYKNLGFLAWDNRAPSHPAHDPAATRDLPSLDGDLRGLVTVTGESGCGYEASLESWYRFLVDPNPAESATILDDGRIQLGATDQTLLSQRQAFLRPDSLVAIVMLTDENDCSARADNYGWLVGAAHGDLKDHPPNATSACDSAGPNDPCCTSCWSTAPLPASCTPVDQDAKCTSGRDNRNSDPSNARCWQQKRRFGMDLLYPTSRYAVALRSRNICPQSTFGDSDCSCTRANELGAACDPGPEVPNPLYLDLATGKPSLREPSLVFLAGIVGVPWQDIASPPTLDPASPDLRYLTAEELAAPVPGHDFSYWDLILGDPEAGVLPRDPYMVETPGDRLGLPAHPRVDAPMAPASAPTASASPINGHEWNAPFNASYFDLQYACTFALPPELQRTCTGNETNCDCTPSENAASPLENVRAAQKPLCQDPITGEYGTRQQAGKAYPGLRHLEVLKQAGSQSIVASICPKSLQEGPSYGYNPAVDALVDRLKTRLGDKCLPRRLEPDPTTGGVPCRVIEALPPERCAEAIPLPGRTRLEGGNPVREVALELQAQKRCDTESTGACSNWCFFEIDQLQGMLPGQPLHGCQHGDESDVGADTAGYCYVDADQGIGSAELLKNCPASEQRLLRFVGENTPRSGAITFYACRGAATR